MKILILGENGSGKSTAGNILAAWMGVTYMESSRYCLEHVVYPALSPRYGYHTPEECYEDRDNHRQEWYDIIKDYNDTGDRVAKEILMNHGICVGLRGKEERLASLHLFDLVIWVEAGDRIDTKTYGPEIDGHDYITLDNTGDIHQLLVNLDRIYSKIIEPKLRSRKKLSLPKYDLLGYVGASATMSYGTLSPEFLVGRTPRIDVRVSTDGRLSTSFMDDRGKLFVHPSPSKWAPTRQNVENNLVVSYRWNGKTYDIVVPGVDNKRTVSADRMVKLFAPMKFTQEQLDFMFEFNRKADKNFRQYKAGGNSFNVAYPEYQELNCTVLRDALWSIPKEHRRTRGLNLPMCYGEVVLFSSNNVESQTLRRKVAKDLTTICGMVWEDLVVLWDSFDSKPKFYVSRTVTPEESGRIVKVLSNMQIYMKRIQEIITTNGNELITK